MRVVESFNHDWIFVNQNLSLEQVMITDGQSINIPHTWNNIDGQDGGSDYKRGICWYVKRFEMSQVRANKKVYLEFQGVNSIAKVFINGEELVCHKGGYSTFRVNITDNLRTENILCVSVDNGNSDSVYPQFADFTFYGGIYRSVELITVEDSHFDLDYYGGSGIDITSDVSGDSATINVLTYITQAKSGQMIEVVILDQEGKTVLQKSQPVEEPKFEFFLNDVHLWNGIIDPYLYKAEIRLKNETEILDDKDINFGFRYYHVDPEKGFFLNGKSYPLRGVARHQDRQGFGNAISKEDQLEDMQLIAEMGANTIRLAHYQHDQYFYDLCDIYGMIVWAEIPFISKPLINGHDNVISQMKELIIQNYNHPSIVCWGLSNEITLNNQIGERLIDIHKELDKLCHELDKTRLTTLASIGNLEIDNEINTITDILSYNHYFGWYYGEIEDNEKFFDEFHLKYPQRCIGISEYGCDANLEWHTNNPKKGDYTEEYQACYHEKMLQQIMERPYLWATHVWNMFDFGADGRDEGKNTKGLVSFDRKVKKDSFYLYKAYLSNEKFIHLCGKRYIDRIEETTKIKVYSNVNQISLFVNDELIAEQEGKFIYEFDIKLKKGDNKIVVKSCVCECWDEALIKRVDEANKSYSNPFFVTSGTNWFTADGSAIEIRFPEGYYSIRDKVCELQKLPNIEPFLREAVQSAVNSWGGTLTVEAMLKILENQTFETFSSNSGKNLDRDPIFKLNQELNKIPKK